MVFIILIIIFFYYLTENPRISNRATRHQNVIAPAHHHPLPARRGREDISIPDHRNRDGFLHRFHHAPISEATVPLPLRPAVDCDRGGARFFGRLRHLHRVDAPLIDSGTDLDRHRLLHRAHDGFDELPDLPRIVQQRASRPRLEHLPRRAAAVHVDDVKPPLHELRRLDDLPCVRAEELDRHRPLGRVGDKHLLGPFALAHQRCATDELGAGHRRAETLAQCTESDVSDASHRAQNCGAGELRETAHTLNETRNSFIRLLSLLGLRAHSSAWSERRSYMTARRTAIRLSASARSSKRAGGPGFNSRWAHSAAELLLSSSSLALFFLSCSLLPLLLSACR